jgi:hypothetical protein
MKRAMTIEDAVIWAFKEELPKENDLSGRAPAGYPSGFGSALNQASGYWAVPSNGFGVVPDLSAAEAPHPDAVAIFQAVRSLDDVVVTIPADWNPLGDLADLGPEVVDAAMRALHQVCGYAPDRSLVLRSKLSTTVRTAVFLGPPECHVGAERPERIPIQHGGKPRWFRKVRRVIGEGATARVYENEEDGRNPRTRRPYPGAYHKYVLQPDPMPIAADRVLYEVWRRSMDVLYADLDGLLDGVDLRPCSLPDRPWEEPVQAPVQVGQTLPDLRFDRYGRPALTNRRLGKTG